MALFKDTNNNHYSIGFRYNDAQQYIDRAITYSFINYKVVARKASNNRLYQFRQTASMRCGKEKMIRFLFDFALDDMVYVKVDHIDEVVYITLIPKSEKNNLIANPFELL